MQNTAKRLSFFWISIFILLLASNAGAQKVEIAPFITLPFGGEFESEFRDDFLDFDLDDGSGYGLSLGYALTRDLHLEFFWSHQESDLVEGTGFFFRDTALTDLEIDYYHAGVLYHWGGGQFRPFIAGSLGITEFGPKDPVLENETRFSVGVGAGAKILFNKRFGLRFEARAFTPVIDEGDEFCRRGSCFYNEGTYFLQGELRGGLLFAF